MDEFKFYIKMHADDVKMEQHGDVCRIYFRSRGVVDSVRKLIDDLIIYVKYRDR
jgi:hypothetical protein